MQIVYDDINPDSDRNAHSNHLCKWIGLIRFRFKSAQCEFRVDAINSLSMHIIFVAYTGLKMICANSNSQLLHPGMHQLVLCQGQV